MRAQSHEKICTDHLGIIPVLDISRTGILFVYKNKIRETVLSRGFVRLPPLLRAHSPAFEWPSRTDDHVDLLVRWIESCCFEESIVISTTSAVSNKQDVFVIDDYFAEAIVLKNTDCVFFSHPYSWSEPGYKDG